MQERLLDGRSLRAGQTALPPHLNHRGEKQACVIRSSQNRFAHLVQAINQGDW